MPDELITVVREKYLIGLYFGFAVNVSKDTAGVDFYIAADNVMLQYQGSLPRLPLNGFHFIDSRFDTKRSAETEFDFVFIGNSQRRKNLLELLRAIGSMSESPKFCIVNRVGLAIESQLYSVKVRQILRALPHEVRKRVRYIEIPPHGDSIPSFLMSELLAASRSLVCISRAEGAARVVAEAVLNNLPIVYYSKMIGGTCNHLDDSIDFRLNDIGELPLVLDRAYLELLDRGRQERGDGDVYLESNSKKVLVKFLREHFSEQLSSSVEEIILRRPLYNAFSGHQNHLPESMSSRASDEVLSLSKMYRLFNYLLGIERKVPFNLKVRDVSGQVLIPWRSFKGFIKAVLS